MKYTVKFVFPTTETGALLFRLVFQYLLENEVLIGRGCGGCGKVLGEW